MNRRNFLQGMAAALGALFAGRAAVTAKPVRTAPVLPSHVLSDVYHTGVVYSPDPYIFVAGSDLSVGDLVHVTGLPFGIASDDGLITRGTVVVDDPTLHVDVFVAEMLNPC